MNEQERNDVIASHEDDALNRHLDLKDEESCERCMEGLPYIMHDDMFICQDCYEDACEEAEARADREEDR